MIKNKAKLLNSTVLVWLILALFLVEFIATLLLQFGEPSKTRLVGVYKFFFQVVILLSIDYKNLNKKILYLFITLTLIFSLNQLLNPIFNKDFNWLFLKGSIYYYDRYIYVILFALMIYSRQDSDRIINKTLKIAEYILVANLALIIIGLLFKIDFFKSYPRSIRFGYDGLFNKVNEVTFIYSIYLIYLYYKSFIIKSRKWIFFIIVSIISLLIGTKVMLLFLALLFVFHFVVVYKKNKGLKVIAIGLILGFIIFFQKITYFVLELFPFWNKLKEEYGLMTLLLSKRDFLFYQSIDYMSANWRFINYFIGGAFYSNSFAISQMDGPDLFLFFGGIGTLVYLSLFVVIFMKKNNIIINGLILIILICGLLGGALLMSPLSMVLLFIVSYSLNKMHKFEYNIK